MSEERKTIYLCLAHMSEEGWEQKYVKEAFDTNLVVPMGPNVNAFEKDLEAFVNSKTNETEPLDRKVVCLLPVRLQFISLSWLAEWAQVTRFVYSLSHSAHLLIR